MDGEVRVLVSGSRECDVGEVEELVRGVFGGLAAHAADQDARVVIITGGARGVDEVAMRVAAEMLFTVVTVFPQWNTAPVRKRAALDRNIEMLERWSPDYVLCFDAGTNGTGHQRSQAEARGIPVRTYPIRKVAS